MYSNKPKPIPEKVKDLFYLKEGVVYNKVDRSKRARKDQPAGAVNIQGYIHIGFDGKYYRAHRIAWFLHYGEQPPIILDHIDGNKTNNKISNLREATPNENQYNQKLARHNTSGVKGVSWNKGTNKWQAHIQINGKKKNLGYYTCIEEAEQAVKEAREQLHKEFAHNGE